MRRELVFVIIFCLPSVSVSLERKAGNVTIRDNMFSATSCDEVINRMKYVGYKIKDCAVQNGNLYYRVEDRLNWADARRACRVNYGAELVSIHDFDENRLVRAMAENNIAGIDTFPNGNGIWIGAYRNNCNQLMVWSDESTWDYDDWWRGQPSCCHNCCYSHTNCEPCPSEMCVHVWFRYIPDDVVNQWGVGWNDAPCCGLMRSICKAPVSVN